MYRLTGTFLFYQYLTNASASDADLRHLRYQWQLGLFGLWDAGAVIAGLSLVLFIYHKYW